MLAFLPQVRTRLGTGSLASSQCGVWLVRAARARSGEETSSKASIRDRAPSNDDHSREGSTSPLAKAWLAGLVLGPLVETRVVDTMRSCTPRLWSPDRRAPRRETETASIDAGDTARAAVSASRRCGRRCVVERVRRFASFGQHPFTALCAALLHRLTTGVASTLTCAPTCGAVRGATTISAAALTRVQCIEQSMPRVY